MKTIDNLTKEACELGISAWRADYNANIDGEFLALNDFIFRIKKDVDSGKYSKAEAALPLIVTQIVGFTSTKELGKYDVIRDRIDTTRGALQAIELPTAQKNLLNRMIDLIENYCLPEKNNTAPYFQFEKSTVPDYLFEFYNSFLRYKQVAGK